MHTPTVVGAALQLLVCSLVVQNGVVARPFEDQNQVALRKALNPLNAPFSRKHRDRYDHKVDAVGKGLYPEPWRNGDGATVMGPRNRQREQQNPDMIRPPSTDHGNLPNMRWSFADSHVRIEVCQVF